MNIEYININDVKPYENNPRNNENAVEPVANSIKKFGFKNPIIVDKNMIIINGHTRLKAAYKLALTKVPVVIASDLTDEEVKAFRLADNKVSEIAEWDTKLLQEELDNIQFDIDMNKFGFEIEPDFEPGTLEEQGDLSMTNAEPNVITAVCPKCGEEFKINDIKN